ncbi:hypothetical protein CVT26_002369 [Gymnopilus dilepis]|uniref:MARVEL domain-containing protein n=1 Tax=Gymnopilus dilepis TaxID=231916 RepID=A0A409Y3U2_9AGAR|nr:hypothetical protein CVT26_002369 [Gymnopilus dilepis]
MNYFYIYRNVIFGLIVILSFPVLGLSAVWSEHKTGLAGASSFEGMAIFTACLSIVLFPALALLPIFRKNAFVLYIISEILILLVMWIFWMTSMILIFQMKCPAQPVALTVLKIRATPNTKGTTTPAPPTINKSPTGSANTGPQPLSAADAKELCDDLNALRGLSVFIFVIVLKYLLYLTIVALVNHARGNYIWQTSVKDLSTKYMPTIKLTHSPASSSESSIDVERKAPNNLTPGDHPAQVVAPVTYPPVPPPLNQNQSQQVPNASAQPQPTFAPQSSSQYAYPAQGVQQQSPGQVVQTISYSQRPPASASQATLRPAPMVPSLPQV